MKHCTERVHMKTPANVVHIILLVPYYPEQKPPLIHVGLCMRCWLYFCGVGAQNSCVAVLLVHSKLRIWNEIKGRHKRTNCENTAVYFYVRLLFIPSNEVARFARNYMYNSRMVSCCCSCFRVCLHRKWEKNWNLGCLLLLFRAYRVHVCVCLMVLFSERWTFTRPLNWNLCLMPTNQPSSGLFWFAYMLSVFVFYALIIPLLFLCIVLPVF